MIRKPYISISFIVFTYNSSDIIQRNLIHLKNALDYCPVDHEILLVDNNSKDNTKDTTDDGAKSEIHHKNGVDNDDMDIDKENNNEVTLKEKESLITKLEYLTNDELVDVKYIILNKLTLHIDNILILRN